MDETSLQELALFGDTTNRTSSNNTIAKADGKANIQVKEANQIVEETESTGPSSTTSSSPSSSTLSSLRYPQGLRLAIVGDSLSRYMYLSLVYYLKHGGEWAPRGHQLLEKVKDPNPSAWNDWLAFTHAELDPLEDCDCYRYWTKAFKWYKHCENRYFHSNSNAITTATTTATTTSSTTTTLDPSATTRNNDNDNYVTFITKFGGNPFHGHWDANSVYREGSDTAAVASANTTTARMRLGLNQTLRTYSWSFDSWHRLVDEYISKLVPKPTIFLFNQGHWKGHELRETKVLEDLQNALKRHGIRGVYRTTTFRQEETNYEDYKHVSTRNHDEKVCQYFECMNVSWTANVPESEYVDPVHFKAPVNNQMSQQFLREVIYGQTS